MEKEKKNSRKKRNRLFFLIPISALVLAVIVAALILNRGSSYRLKGSAVQYYAESSVTIESGAVLKRKSDGTTTLTLGNYSTEINLPIYYSESRSVVLPDDMIYFAPRSGDCARMKYFSEVECKTNGTVVVYSDGNTITEEPGFLYDGKDLYLFLEPVVLTFNGYTMELPALSYVEAVYGGYIMVFNYDTKKMFMELAEGSATAKTPSDDYTVSLIGDSMTLYDGTRSLLATRADLLEPCGN